jgi:hypothetical protein
MAPLNQNSALQLRRSILTQLYAWFQEVPLAPVELSRLAESCAAAAQELNWNIIYMEKKGWVALSRDSNCPPFVACSVELTGAGIDLIEDPATFERQFPGS